jgi:hypothetical protein
MEYSGHIGRRNNNGVRRPEIRLTREITFFNPMAIPFVFDIGGDIILAQIHRNSDTILQRAKVTIGYEPAAKGINKKVPGWEL